MGELIITGASGYIGKHLLNKLLGRNYFIVFGVRVESRFQLRYIP